MYRCSHLYCVSTPEVLFHLLCINLQDNNICFAKGGPGEIPLDHFLTYYLFFLSLETISDRICLSFNMGVLIRHPLMFTRQGLFYYTVENCLKFDVKKGVCTQFIILSENFIRIIIISYKYIIYLNLHIHVYLSLIVGDRYKQTCMVIRQLFNHRVIFTCIVHYCVNDEYVVQEQNTCNLSSNIMVVLYDYCIHFS